MAMSVGTGAKRPERRGGRRTQPLAQRLIRLPLRSQAIALAQTYDFDGQIRQKGLVVRGPQTLVDE